MKLKKYEANPILSPNSHRAWENLVRTNPGACCNEETGEVTLLSHAAEDNERHRTNIGMAKSKNSNVVIDGMLFVSYGGAEQYVGVATCGFESLLEKLREHPVG